MKKIYARWKAWAESIPRKKRVAAYLLLILLCCFGLYIFRYTPPFGWEHKYRRIEKAHMVGPGDILGREKVTGSFYRDIVLAQTDDGLIVSTISMYDADMDILQYLPKTGKISIVGVPQDPQHTITLEDAAVTVLIAEEYPQATRAELDLRLYWQQFPESEPEYPVFHASASREQEGYFRLDIPFPRFEDSKEHKILELYCDWIRGFASGFPSSMVPKGTYMATVRLYDSGGQLLTEQTLSLANEL